MYAITVIASLAGALGACLGKRGEEIDAAAKPAQCCPMGLFQSWTGPTGRQPCPRYRHSS